MADNVPITAGTGTDIATDDVSGAHYQRFKLDLGSDGASSPLVRGAQSTANSIPVTLPSDVTLPLPSGAATQATLETLLTEGNFDTKVGSLIEAAPASDTASSGLNGRLQRIAQRITSLITALGSPFQAGGSIGNAEFGATQSGSWTVTAANSAGDIAHDSADSGSPVKIGGQARTTNPTAVADTDRVNAMFDDLGKQVVVGSVRDLKVTQKTTITSSTSETTVLTAVASTFLDVYGVVVTNTSATATKVTFKDATAGTTRFIIQVPATETRGFMLPESGAHVQASVNNNWTAACGTSVDSVEITMLAVKNI